MKLSIITCTYNSETYLPKCIDSVIVQHLNPLDFEHIFVDGNSTDETLQIIQTYKKEHPEYHITVLQAEPKGIYNAMNLGVRQSGGEYTMFLNSDDFLEEDVLCEYLEQIKTNADIYYGKLRKIDNGKILSIFPNHYIWLRKILFAIGFGTLFGHPTTLIKKALFEELGYYDETKKMASDFGFFLLCKKNKKKFEYFPKIISNFRVHEKSITGSHKHQEELLEEVLYFRKKYFGIFGKIMDSCSRIYLKITSLL